MNVGRRKKIRTDLINFTNNELQKNKKLKKYELLINSMTLEELEQKNMQCKYFCVKEKDHIYQNINNRRIIGLNIYINDTSNNNPLIHSLSNFINSDTLLQEIQQKKGEKIQKINSITPDKETLLQIKSNKILYVQKEGNFGSPVDPSIFVKKEVGERKLKRPSKELNSNKVSSSYSDANILRDTEEKNGLIQRLSKESLEPEISRIIKLCHDERNNSYGLFHSDSHISQISKEIHIAKMYAKKLKIYSRTLKNKLPINQENEKNKHTLVEKNKSKKNNSNMNLKRRETIKKDIILDNKNILPYKKKKN